jgi:hypothetical protein
MFLLAVAVSALVCAQASANINLDPWKTAYPNDWAYELQATWELGGAGLTNIAPDTYTLDRWPLPELRAPSASIYVEDDPYTPAVDPLVGPLALGGTVYASPVMRIDLAIPDIVDPDLWKVVQVELVYQTQVTPVSGYMYSTLTAGGVVYAPDDVVETTTAGWTDLTLTWELPNQLFDWEFVSVWLHDSGVTLDSIEVGTVCVPIPGAVLLGFLGLSAAGLKLRKHV